MGAAPGRPDDTPRGHGTGPGGSGRRRRRPVGRDRRAHGADRTRQERRHRRRAGTPVRPGRGHHRSGVHRRGRGDQPAGRHPPAGGGVGGGPARGGLRRPDGGRRRHRPPRADLGLTTRMGGGGRTADPLPSARPRARRRAGRGAGDGRHRPRRPARPRGQHRPGPRPRPTPAASAVGPRRAGHPAATTHGHRLVGRHHHRRPALRRHLRVGGFSHHGLLRPPGLQPARCHRDRRRGRARCVLPGAGGAGRLHRRGATDGGAW